MRTLIIIGIGLLLLAVAVALSPAGWRARAALMFIPVWLLASGINLSIGLTHGYSLREEVLIHVALFGLPAAAAVACWFRFRSG